MRQRVAGRLLLQGRRKDHHIIDADCRTEPNKHGSIFRAEWREPSDTELVKQSLYLSQVERFHSSCACSHPPASARKGMTSAMISVLRMPAQLHSPSAPSTAAATISTPPRPRAALRAQVGSRQAGGQLMRGVWVHGRQAS